jgi:hypothetical protein
MPRSRERRQTFDGGVEIWVGGVKRSDAKARLFGYVEITGVPVLGPRRFATVEGVTSWGGQLELSDLDGSALLGTEFELRFPGGRVGEAVLLNSSGWIQGSGETPFD